MLEMVVFAIEPREIGGQRVDEILPILGRAMALEIVDIGIKARQAQRTDDL
ncbi:hypothetical protein D3C87_1871040 [compost metagenome]